MRSDQQPSLQLLLPNLKNYRVILASKSPRRQELLKETGLIFEVYVIDGIDETFPTDMPIEKIPTYLSLKKSFAYDDLVSIDKNLIITADTIVVMDNQVLGKPNDYDHAYKMLSLLSGKMHQVITGVTIRSKEKTTSVQSTTKVWFKELSQNEIDYYINIHQPFDKAGAYGIQEWIGHIGIQKVEGSYFNVVGLPIQQLYYSLSQF